jgi:hypothetical protein
MFAEVIVQRRKHGVKREMRGLSDPGWHFAVRRQSEAATAFYVRQTSVCRFNLSGHKSRAKLKFVGLPNPKRVSALRLLPHSKLMARHSAKGPGRRND